MSNVLPYPSSSSALLLLLLLLLLCILITVKEWRHNSPLCLPPELSVIAQRHSLHSVCAVRCTAHTVWIFGVNRKGCMHTVQCTNGRFHKSSRQCKCRVLIALCAAAWGMTHFNQRRRGVCNPLLGCTLRPYNTVECGNYAVLRCRQMLLCAWILVYIVR